MRFRCTSLCRDVPKLVMTIFVVDLLRTFPPTTKQATTLTYNVNYDGRVTSDAPTEKERTSKI